MEVDQLVKERDRNRSEDPPESGVQLEADSMEHSLF